MAWTHYETLTVAGGGGTASFAVPLPREEVSKLTVWAMSGPVVTMVFQPRINGINFSGSTSVAAARAADVVYSSGGAGTEDLMFPRMPQTTVPYGTTPPPLQMVFDILVTNNGVAAESVTLWASALTHGA